MTSRQQLHERLESFLQLILSRIHAEGLDQLVEMELSLTQARTMFVTAQARRPLAINEIADAVGVSVAAAGRTVDSLVRVGTLERHENPDDRRIKLVGLTPQGFAAVDEQFEHKRRALRQVADQLDPEDAEHLDQVLGQILASDALSSTPGKDA